MALLMSASLGLGFSLTRAATAMIMVSPPSLPRQFLDGTQGCFVNDASLSHCGKHL
jgi:hypothetical protein